MNILDVRYFIKSFLRRLVSVDPLEPLLRTGLVVGKDFRMHEDVTIDACHCWHIAIGDDVTLAPRVHILAHDASTRRLLGYTRIGKVRIGNRVFVGESSIILPGVTIGNDVIVGAGSIVTRNIPDGVVVAGNPATKISTIEEFLRKRRNEMDRVPCFEEAYTLRGGVSDRMKNEMNERMISGYGFIV